MSILTIFCSSYQTLRHLQTTLSLTCSYPSGKDTAHHINTIMSLIIAWSKKWQVTAPVKTQAIGILGVQIVRRLIFTDHVRRMAKNAAKLTCIRRSAPLLDAKDYHSQVRCIMDSCPCMWSFCPIIPGTTR